eukprot:403374831
MTHLQLYMGQMISLMKVLMKIITNRMTVLLIVNKLMIMVEKMTQICQNTEFDFNNVSRKNDQVSGAQIQQFEKSELDQVINLMQNQKLSQKQRISKFKMMEFGSVIQRSGFNEKFSRFIKSLEDILNQQHSNKVETKDLVKIIIQTICQEIICISSNIYEQAVQSICSHPNIFTFTFEILLILEDQFWNYFHQPKLLVFQAALKTNDLSLLQDVKILNSLFKKRNFRQAMIDHITNLQYISTFLQESEKNEKTLEILQILFKQVIFYPYDFKESDLHMQLQTIYMPLIEKQNLREFLLIFFGAAWSQQSHDLALQIKELLRYFNEDGNRVIECIYISNDENEEEFLKFYDTYFGMQSRVMELEKFKTCTQKLLELKLKYLDLRDKIIKKTLGRHTLSNGEPYQVLPGIEKQKALRALQWDKVFYSNKKENHNHFDKKTSVQESQFEWKEEQFEGHLKFLDQIKSKMKNEKQEFDEYTNYFSQVQSKVKSTMFKDANVNLSMKKFSSAAQLPDLPMVYQIFLFVTNLQKAQIFSMSNNHEQQPISQYELNVPHSSTDQNTDDTFVQLQRDIDVINSYRELKQTGALKEFKLNIYWDQIKKIIQQDLIQMKTFKLNRIKNLNLTLKSKMVHLYQKQSTLQIQCQFQDKINSLPTYQTNNAVLKEDGFIYFRDLESFNINLKNEAFPGVIYTMNDLQEKYALMIKLQDVQSALIPNGNQKIYEQLFIQLYMTIAMMIVFDNDYEKCHLKNKIADVDFQRDTSPIDIKTLLQIYKQLTVDQLLFPEIVKRHQKFVNKLFPKSKLYDFLKGTKLAIEFGNKILQVYSMYNFIDLSGGQLPNANMMNDLNQQINQGDRKLQQTVKEYMEKKTLGFQKDKVQETPKKVLLLVDGSKLSQNIRGVNNSATVQSLNQYQDGPMQNLISQENSLSEWKQIQISKPQSMDLKSNKHLRNNGSLVVNPSIQSINMGSNLNGAQTFQQYELVQQVGWNQMLSCSSAETGQRQLNSRATSKRTIFIKESKGISPGEGYPPDMMLNGTKNIVSALIREENKVISPLRQSNYMHSSHQQNRIKTINTPFSAQSKRSSGHMSSCYSVLDFKIPTANFHHMIGNSPSTRGMRIMEGSEIRNIEQSPLKFKIKADLIAQPHIFSPKIEIKKSEQQL